MNGSALPTTPSADAQILADLDALPPLCRPWLEEAGLYGSRAWLEANLEAALPPDAQPKLLLAYRDATPQLLLPLVAMPGGQWQSLTTPYSCLFSLPGAPGLDDPGWHAAGVALARILRRHATIRLEALDTEAPGLASLVAGLHEGGLVALTYDHFGNWHEDVAGTDWKTYLERRPGALRETIRRRLRAAERDAVIRFTIASAPDDIPAALEAYESVYRRSWKTPEPFPHFHAALLPRLAVGGWLRLGVLWRGDEPIAAQYWTVWDGGATVHKLAHDDAHKPLSPGTVLTAMMIRHLLDDEHVATLDFGRGDDEYKEKWVGCRRQRIGTLLVNPRKLRGAAALLRHKAGRLHAALKRA